MNTMNSKKEISVFWFRRDLRLHDNAGLYAALIAGYPVLPVFVFDTDILNALEDKADKRLEFIHRALAGIQAQLEGLGSTLKFFHGQALDAFKELTETYEVKKIYCNRDYEPAAIVRDKGIENFASSKGIEFKSFKDQVVLEYTEVLKEDNNAYTIFTPYMKRYKSNLTAKHLIPFESEKQLANLLKTAPESLPTLKQLGFESCVCNYPSANLNKAKLLAYAETRDIPALDATSKMSVHLRFGTVSVRALMQEAINSSEKWWNELIWREFYMMILAHFPHVVNSAFKPAYNQIMWRNNEVEFEAWCTGKTGYPIVDAGMRELNLSGFMHNRVRMVVASFLTKHLLIDWKWGEAYFAKKLLDFELASNNGGWQWAAGSGCDAAPYFRVFNPYEQTRKFDPQLIYIRKWVPEFESFDYPRPIVEHKFARERVLKTYKNALTKQDIPVESFSK